MDQKPKQKKGFARIWAALFYSLDGLRSAIRNEAAFRQELFLAVVAIIVLAFLPLPLAWKGLLFLATTLVLVVELLNSSIESVVDMASPEYHVLAKRAKDFGSAAVLVSILVTISLWLVAFLSLLN